MTQRMLTEKEMLDVKQEIAGLAFICQINNTAELVEHVIKSVEDKINARSVSSAETPCHLQSRPEDCWRLRCNLGRKCAGPL